MYAFSWIWAGGYEGVSRTMAPESVVSGPWPLFSQPPLYGQVLSFLVFMGLSLSLHILRFAAHIIFTFFFDVFS